MFQDLKVSTRLSLAFGIVLVLLLAVIAVGVTRMQLIDREMTLITAVNDVEIRHATEMEATSLSMGVDLRDALLTTDATVTKDLFAKVRDGAASLDKEAAAIARMFAEDAGTTQGEKDELAKIQEALKELQPLRERIAAAVSA
jgi:methyl-accepting chemotaxis protein